MAEKHDGIQQLIETGRGTGFLSAGQILAVLEESGFSTAQMDRLCEAMEAGGICVSDLPPDVLPCATDQPPDSFVQEQLEKASRTPPLSADEERRLLREIRENGSSAAQARQRLEEAGLRLVVSTAAQYVGRGVLFADLLREGELGLLRALGRADRIENLRFPVYADWWVRQAITRAVAAQVRPLGIPASVTSEADRLKLADRQLQDHLGRAPYDWEVAKLLGTTPEEVYAIRCAQKGLEKPVHADADTPYPDEIAFAAVKEPTMREFLAIASQNLPPREKRILCMLCGFENGHCCKAAKVAWEFGVSQERVLQIRERVMSRVQDQCRRAVRESMSRARHQRLRKMFLD